MATGRKADTEDGNTAGGRTRWKVFALVLAAGFSGVAVMLTGLSKGAVAASFTVSGTSYKASADKLTGEGVVQFGSVDRSADEAHPVLVNGFQHAKLTNFCQSIHVTDLPGLGDATVRIKAADGMSADNLVLGIDQVDGDLTLNNVEIGRDASELSAGPDGAQGAPGGFGIQASGATIDDLRQQAWSTTASTLNLNDVNISVVPGDKPCF
ncbi:DUF6230 family protein [Actinopolyspora mortivallis]|uniref:DUF6230 family protein n=1 Tax=Actinopolyspora mortivallis TaxID=33906 RepID=UPI00037107B7|nr:DUF6230 family protein [Actinopolyspora mortivallis]